MNDPRMPPEITQIEERQWQEARRCLPVIQGLAQRAVRTRADVEAAARSLGYGPTHIYALLRRYLADPRLTSLLPRLAGRPRGLSLCAEEIDGLINEVIETVYLTRQRARVSDVEAEVRRRCHLLGLTPPGRKAITARVRAKPRHEVVARREGRKAARDLFAPATGSLKADWPLALVQIDHTLVDVIVVDRLTRAPIQRPWLTLAIDVHSRCVVGFHLSLEPPSATSVALCVAQAILPKAQWLAERKIEAEWPVHGLMARLHLDNAKEFRSDALRRGCEQYGIAIDYRPVRTPHYGGHIERLIGTMMGKVHLLPGTTFSDVRAKGDLNPEKTAAMTIEELERWLGHAIAGIYHRTLHRALGTTPLAAWERGIVGDATTPGRGEPVSVPDPRRLLIDFLPIERRRVRREGVSLHSIHYWSDVLRVWIGEPQQMIIRYDPRDLSRIHLLAPDGHYYDLSYRDLRRPPITLWEHRQALKRLREEGRANIDESAIFRTIEIMRTITDEAVIASKSARRQRERRLRLIQGGRTDPTPAAQAPADVASESEGEEQSKLQPWERMLPVEEW
ncbi:MAG: Mu transposase C-terminal domain-containing protein [Steroidobacteraceae bacterium]